MLDDESLTFDDDRTPVDLKDRLVIFRIICSFNHSLYPHGLNRLTGSELIFQIHIGNSIQMRKRTFHQQHVIGQSFQTHSLYSRKTEVRRGDHLLQRKMLHYVKASSE